MDLGRGHFSLLGVMWFHHIRVKFKVSRGMSVSVWPSNFICLDLVLVWIRYTLPNQLGRVFGNKNQQTFDLSHADFDQYQAGNKICCNADNLAPSAHWPVFVSVEKHVWSFFLFATRASSTRERWVWRSVRPKRPTITTAVKTTTALNALNGMGECTSLSLLMSFLQCQGKRAALV